MIKKFFAATLVAACVFAVSVSAQKSRIGAAVKYPAAKSLRYTNAAAYSDGNGVYLRWSTEGERDVLGFFVLRYGRDGFEYAGDDMIPGSYLRNRLAESEFGEYTFFDADGAADASYLIETVSVNGSRTKYGAIPVTIVPDLRLVAGTSSDELRRTSLSSKSETAVANRLPSDLRKELSEFLRPADVPTQRWVAAQPGVKILVRQKGVYRVSRSDLQNAGFNVAAPGNLWQLFAEGREQAIIVGAGDSYIEFYGEAVDAPESNTRAYFLVVGAADGKRIGPKVLRPLSSPVASVGYAQSMHRKERASYLSGILNGAAENFFGSQIISSTATTTYNLNIPAIETAVPQSNVRLSLQGLTVSPHNVEVTINGQLMATTVSWQGQTLGIVDFSVPTSLLVDGPNVIQLRGLAGSSDFSFIESVRVDYARKFSADQNQLSFFTANYRTATVTGFASPNVRLFDVSDPDNPAQILGPNAVPGANGFDITLPSNRGRLVQAVEDSGLRAPVGIVQNFPSDLNSPTNGANMILVTHRDWLAQAQAWAAYRDGQGTTVKVVDVADIYDEFGFGVQDSAAMTAFFQHARDNWATAPGYVMLLGDSTFDPKNYLNAAFKSYVPTEFVDTLYEETGSDEALLDFNGDGLSELAVGRIPVRSGADVTQVLNKVSAFEGNLTNAMDRGALFVADEPIGYDFEGVNNRVSQQLPSSMPKTFIAKSNPDARTQLLAELNLGKYIVNYAGHGSTLFWAASNFYHRNDLPNMTNTNNLTVFTLLTCLNGYYLNPSLDSFAETAIKTPNGGAVVAWASSGKTTPDIQEVMATRFYNQIGLGSITRIGDLVKDAKAAVVGGRDVRLSWTLFGDPAMKVR